MFKILLIVLGIFFAQTASAQKNPQTLEEINADLIAKKAAMDPFHKKEIKVDLESLGLDDLDKKAGEKKAEEAAPKKNEVKPEEIIDKKTEVLLKSEKVESSNKGEQKNEAAPSINPIVATTPVGGSLPESQETTAKIQNLLNKTTSEEEAKKVAAEKKKPAVKYVNAAKKRNEKKRLAEEKKRKENQKKQQEKLEKLHELRQKYLIKIEENPGFQSDGFSDDQDEEKIIPRRKELNRFVSDEVPALPILNRFRTNDNIHIPTILTPVERIDVLFSAISQGNVAYFNSAYKDIENPNVKNQIGDTLLTYSVLLQKEDIIASVLGKGADPNRPNSLGYTPMDIAIEMLDIKALQLLIDNKADPKYLDGFGRTYLMHASRVGFLPAVELFVQQGVDVNAMDNDGFTALSIAYRHKKEIIIAYLLKHGAKTWIEKPYDPGNQSLIKELENRWE